MGYWTHFRDERRLARKPHRCWLCDRCIVAGDTYVERVGADEGIVVMRMHAACVAETRDWDISDWESNDESDFAARMEDLETKGDQ